MQLPQEILTKPETLTKVIVPKDELIDDSIISRSNSIVEIDALQNRILQSRI